MVAVGLVLLLVPEPPKVPLVPSDGWKVKRGFFQNVRPAPEEVSRSILESPGAVFWRSWRPGGAQPGALTSAPFPAPSVLVVPFAGYPGRPGIELFVECLATGARRPVARGNSHETWVERTMWLGSRWCPSEVRLVARSSSRVDYVAVGTPFRSSWLSYMKESVFVIAAIHALAWALVLVAGAGLVLLFGVKQPEVALLAAVPVTLLAGYVAFFAVYALGGARARLGILAVLAASGLAAVGKGARVLSGLRSSPMARAFLLSFAVSLAYALVVYAGDIGIGSWAATYRFAPAIWSSDSQLPQMVAEGLYLRRPIAGIIGAGWHVSDRPPLLSGLFLLGRPWWPALLRIGDNHRLAYLFYQVTGLVACTLWVIPAWILLVRALGPVRATRAVALTAATGVVLFNSVYIWPKMLAAALGLGAFLVLARAAKAEPARCWRSYATAGALAGMAFVSHGGVAYGLLPVLAWPLSRPTRARVLGLCAAALAGLAVVLPWMVWQRTVDPPGNALVKFALAGTWGMENPGKGVWDTVRDAHATLTLVDWLGMRWHAVLTLFGRFTPPLIPWFWLQPSDFMGRLRGADFLYLFPALRAANLGWLALAILALRKGSADEKAVARAAGTWTLLGLAGIAVGTLVNFNFNTIHCQSYLSLLLLLLGLFAALSRGPRWLFALAAALQAVYFALVWVWSPLTALDLRLDVLAGLVLVTICIVVAWVIKLER